MLDELDIKDVLDKLLNKTYWIHLWARYNRYFR